MGDKFSISRRRLLQAGAALGGAMLLPGVMQAAWAGGSDKPEQTRVRVGFIPLTDCAPLAIAAAKGFDQKYGITRWRVRKPAGRRCATSWWPASWTRRIFSMACCTASNWGSPASRRRWPI